MKDILIIANFCRDFSKNDNGRFMYLCKALSNNNTVEIITSNFSHTTKSHKDSLVHEWPFKITFINEPGYQRNISLRRFYSHYIWGRNVLKYLKKRNKPDVIYCAIPSLTAPNLVSNYCKKNSIRFIIDIQDLWPEAFKLAFNVPVLSEVIFAPFNHIANNSYKRADVICGVSNTYVTRAKKVNSSAKSIPVFLGTKLETFDYNAAQNRKMRCDNEIWLGYCGSLNASYDITVVIKALNILKKQGNVPPKFIVMGTGEKELYFKEYAQRMNVDCLFTGKLPYDQMCGLLASCDIAINPISHNAAQSIINKHGDYAAAGIPVINTQENKEYMDLVSDYNMGFNCNNSDPFDLAEKLMILISDKDLRIQMGNNARKCAIDKFDRSHTYLSIINAIME